jgi:P4 family phage/plasmid primase-like protien
MSLRTQDNFLDADRLSLDYLIAECIWDPSMNQDNDDGETLELELLRHLCSEALERGDFTLRFWRSEFYHWTDGRYLLISESDIKACIVRHFKEHNRHSETFDRPGRRINITSGLVANVMLCLAGTEGVHIDESRQLNTWDDGRQRRLGIQTFAFSNGMLLTDHNYERPAMAKPTPHYFSLTRLPYSYEPQAECPRWLAFLDDVMQHDAERIELLCQWAGYLLTTDSRRHKFMLIAGEGRNGKTVFTTLLERMVGVENVSHIPLSMFSHPFALAATLGKVLNSTSESCHGLDELAETMLKSFTSGDRMTFQRKFREPVHDVPTTKIMISTNQLPQFADKSEGLWRRLIFVPFENIYPEHRQNPDLADELSEELPGIFNWALAGLKRLRQAGHFVQPERCKQAMAEYRRDVNPARTFLLDNYTAGLEYEGLPSMEVYQSYTRWCEANGYRPMNNSNFGKEVKRAFTSVEKQRSRTSGRPTSIYAGIAVREDSYVAQERTCSEMI